MKEDFIPSTDSKLNMMENTFLNKIDTIGVAMGLTPAEINDVKNAIIVHQTSYMNAYSMKQEMKGLNEENKANKKRAIKLIRSASRRIKSYPGYNDGLGAELGIVGIDHIKDPSSLKPRLKAIALVNKVRIRYPKKRTSGINLYSKRGDEKDFSFLTFDANPPAFDNRPKLDPIKPESRYYKACYVINDNQVGQYSDQVHVLVE
jgi:hypothetical protein